MGAFISFFKSEAPTARTGRHVNPEGEAKRSKDSLVFLFAPLQGANRFIRLCELFLREREKGKLGANELAFRSFPSPPLLQSMFRFAFVALLSELHRVYNYDLLYDEIASVISKVTRVSTVSGESRSYRCNLRYLITIMFHFIVRAIKRSLVANFEATVAYLSKGIGRTEIQKARSKRSDRYFTPRTLDQTSRNLIGYS